MHKKKPKYIFKCEVQNTFSGNKFFVSLEVSGETELKKLFSKGNNYFNCELLSYSLTTKTDLLNTYNLIYEALNKHIKKPMTLLKAFDLIREKTPLLKELSYTQYVYHCNRLINEHKINLSFTRELHPKRKQMKLISRKPKTETV